MVTRFAFPSDVTTAGVTVRNCTALPVDAAWIVVTSSCVGAVFPGPPIVAFTSVRSPVGDAFAVAAVGFVAPRRIVAS
eukprot:SAG25_NODE_745_length_5594_cov_2.305187_2_plen_78_part_00